MDALLDVAVWAHWLHLMAAMTWVGGLVAMALVAQPAARRALPHDLRMIFYEELGRRFVAVQWGCWAVLGVTGAYKAYVFRGALTGEWGRVLAVKLALVAAMVGMSLLHSHVLGPRLTACPQGSPEYRRLVARLAFWGKLNLACVAAIVFCAAVLRISPF